MEIQLYVFDNEWKVRIVKDGETLFTSTGYEEARDCYFAIDHLKEGLAGATIREIGILDNE